MNEDDLTNSVLRVFEDWIDRNFYDKHNLLNTLCSPKWQEQYRQFVRESGIKWDQTLNSLGVRRIEHHLDIPPRKDQIRISDPFASGPNRRRDLEMTRDQATKILALGIP